MTIRRSLMWVIALAVQCVAQSTTFLLPETNSTIKLSFFPDKELPQDYRAILIDSAGVKTRFVAHNQIIRIPATRDQRKAAYIWSADAPGLTLHRSGFFLVGQYVSDAKPHTLLFFLSDAMASNAAPILIIGFTDSGKPIRLFEREYELTSFEPIDGAALMSGKQSVSQGLCDPEDRNAPHSATYDPYSVFVFRPDSKPVYQLAASRAYNRKHYVWMGARASEKLAVIFNFPGHPKVYGVTSAEHDRLMAKVNCH